ncbi:dihydroorotate dehydrogenase [Geosporobacter ferrireducens]|uniref:dihydroorotate dehydrogenase n=1 Tax=Geosporobacter ferrireducens TaxID=1424294 RepID=UPI000A95C607|nr:dihydroorotate dehydrogenase [Geosporobacter ferrireducens]
MNKVDMHVDLKGLKMKNPITVASGTFGFGREYEPYVNLNEIGGIMVKGLTLEPREGNPVPRVAETPMGILNSVGLQNPGVKAFIENELPYLTQFDTKIIANINGNTIEEYCRMAEILSDTSVHALELNISCPNVKEGGVAFGVRPEMVFEVTKKVRKHCGKYLIVKLSPNVRDIKEIALSAEEAGADCLSLINTLIGMAIDIETQKPVLARGIGGLSGPAIKPVALRMVYEAARTVKIPIIGMGGIMEGEDAVEFLLAGASAVSVGTASFVNPSAAADIREGVEAYLARKGYTSVQDIVGKVKF